jgi:hypothetical protein
MGNLFYKTNIIVNLMNNEMRENTWAEVLK